MRLNVVSFDVPFPPDYGGAIDVYYKLKALHDAGVEVELHCFHYGRNIPDKQNGICSRVYYYRRIRNPLLYFQRDPFVVVSRRNQSLITNLTNNQDPILFEGLHSCFYLADKRLKNRLKIVRTHNIEHHYYDQLSKAERGWWKKYYFRSESKKLEQFERVLKHADLIAAISDNDTNYLSTQYSSVFHLPIFHGNETLAIQKGIGKYTLYHGNLAVSENEKAALFLINKVFNDLDIQLIIAGRKPSKFVIDTANQHSNVIVMKDVSSADLLNLIRNAQVNILPTFQPTGIKLKVINALYNGRHCVVNSNMITDPELQNCCVITDTIEEMKKAVIKCMEEEFSEVSILNRREVLLKRYSDHVNVQSLTEKIFTTNKKGGNILNFL